MFQADIDNVSVIGLYNLFRWKVKKKSQAILHQIFKRIQELKVDQLYKRGSIQLFGERYQEKWLKVRG